MSITKKLLLILLRFGNVLMLRGQTEESYEKVIFSSQKKKTKLSINKYGELVVNIPLISAYKLLAKGYISYSDYGAVGDGITNDINAIGATHAFDNKHGLPVKANQDATYYIGRDERTAIIQTDYDIILSRALNVSFVNCRQTNDINDGKFWGIMGSNYCKNLLYDNCVLSRFDAHKGVANATIRNSKPGHSGIAANGTGKLLIDNSIIYSCVLVNLRSDYGSSWQGECIIRNCTFVQIGGNAWMDEEDKPKKKAHFNKEGALNLTKHKQIVRIYFRTEKTGTLQLGLRAKASAGSSTIKVSFEGKNHGVSISDTTWQDINAGIYKIKKPGYHCVELHGIKKADESFGLFKDLLLGGDACVDSVYYVKDELYWGRRGPSVHLTYQVPKEAGDIVYFYNEITVPEGEDVLGSYFMTNGFAEGYFGIQVNSPTERRMLFSVWSPYHTDNPNEIPEEQRIKMLKKGKDVYTGKFGNEGSGGQSYLKYNWKAGTTYGFLLKAHPSENSSTDYTAWFMDPEVNEWQLIASFRRPQTTTYIKRPHSFLEDFYTQMGNTSRMAYYTNQWVRNTEGKWDELTKAKFTADATARKDSRLDYAGGIHDGKFFMKNCGFFSERVAYDQYFEREDKGMQPKIDFSQLK
ncbi:DUF3472 domain-containing protein [Carboxylicivirga marina]|uniref:DUF3472 domain-containing protein n=1 Tax=Carboxylicivirga marina TaxID=2800988 RepID=A0ABS1HPQ0_9BACT|nr:DUF3472 domain-containing protein [Carboxylicivirga marina]MBK3519666.1 DUF3472 domain-containing protein [Carboxylicivirga marina]